MRSLITQIERWRTQDLRLLPPEPKHHIEAAFARFGVQPSDQVVQMYSMIGGFEVPDDSDWRLWPLEEIAAQEPDDRNEFGILFSDYLVDCWGFRLRPASHGEMEILRDRYGAAPEIIAPNLSAFFDIYIVKPLSLVDPGAANSMYP